MNEGYAVTLESPAAIVERDGRRADEVKKRVGEIDTSLTLNTFEQADLLAEIKDNSYWRQWRHESFAEYVKASGIDLSPREVEYRVVISKVSKVLNVTKAIQAKAKMSKLKLITSLDHSTEYTDPTTQITQPMSEIMRNLILDAPNKSLKELAEIVKRLKGESEDPASDIVWLNWPVRRDAKQLVEETLEKAAKKAGQTFDVMTKEQKDLSKAASLELVCGEWLADPNNSEDDFGEQGEFNDESEDGDVEDESVEDFFDGEESEAD